MNQQEALERHFIEEMGLLMEEEAGASGRMMGRILGHLLLCDPPRQSSAQLADALSVSRGAISQSTRSLLTLGLIEKVPVPGERATFFRIVEGAWLQAFQMSFTRLRLARELAERGLALLEGSPPERRRRMEELHEFYCFVETELPILFERYQTWRAAKETP